MSEGIGESKSLWKVNDKPQLLGWTASWRLFYIWNGRKFLYFPPAGFPHSRCPYVCPLPSHADECVYNQCPNVCPSSTFSGETALRDRRGCVLLHICITAAPLGYSDSSRSPCVAQQASKSGEFQIFSDSRVKDFPGVTENKNNQLSHLLKWSL